MTLLNPETLKNLMTQTRGEHCVSLFIPTHRSDPGMRQDRIRLKNLVRQAEEELAAQGLRKQAIDALLQPAHDRIDDEVFWRHQLDGLALFLTEGGAQEYRLTMPVEELCVVNDRFHLIPLLPLITANHSYYILAISQDNVRLFSATRDDIQEMDLEGVPRNLNEALGDLANDGGDLNWRSRDSSIFVGHGGGTDPADVEVRRYVRYVDRALIQKLTYRDAPVVLAAVEKTGALYRQESQIPNLLDVGIEGSPDLLSAEALREKAWPLVEPHFAAEQARALELFWQMEDAGRATTDLQEAMRAAQEGRVGTLFVAIDDHCWGDFDEASREIHLHEERQPGDEDLLEKVAEVSLLKSAVVYAVPKAKMPRHEPVAALYRF